VGAAVKFTSRLDLADFMAGLATSATHVRSTVAIATVSVQPTLVRLLLREAFPPQRACVHALTA